MTKKKVNWEKKYKDLKKSSEESANILQDCIGGLNRKLQDKDKGHTISITAQTFTIKDIAQAQEKVRKLLDAGVWYFEVNTKT